MRFRVLPLILALSVFSNVAAGRTFHVRLAEDLGTLDWNYGEVSPEIVYQLMEGLFRADKNGKPVPAAAASFRWNENKTEMTVKLARNRRWSDGSPLCAQQFVDSWARLKSRELASPYAHYAHVLKRFEALSCQELKISFTRPAPEAEALLAHYVFFPLRADNLEKRSRAFQEGTSLIVNGPFQVSEWKPNQSLTLTRNVRYGRKHVALEGVEFLFVPDDSTAKVMFEQGKIEWMRDVGHILRNAKLERSPEFRVFPSHTAYYWGLNAEKSELLKHSSVRRALFEAMDRTQLPKVLGKEYRGQESWLTRALFPELKKPAKSSSAIREAKAILKKAVADNTMNLKVRVYNKSAHKLLAEWAQGQWEKNLGVRIPIEIQEAKVYWKEIATNPAPIFLSGVTAPYAHPRAFLQEFLGSSTANWTGWKSASYDSAVEEGRYQEAEDELIGAGHVIPVYTRDAVGLVKRDWRGFSVNPMGQVFLEDVASSAGSTK